VKDLNSEHWFSEFEIPPPRTPFPRGVSSSLPTSAERRALSAALPGLGETQLAWEMATWLPGFQINKVSGVKSVMSEK